MNNMYLDEQMARMRQEDALRRAEHQRILAANGLDLYSVVGRAIAKRLAPVRAFAERLVRAPFLQPSAPAELHLVSRAQLERRVDRAA